MYTVAIWENRPVLSNLLPRSLPAEYQIQLLTQVAKGDEVDLLVVAPDFRNTDYNLPPCQILLVPGHLPELAKGAPCAVSYGISPRDSLTLSSLESRTVSLSLQRELVTLSGDTLERQELILPRVGHSAPLPFLACAGALLLLGIGPELLSIAPPA